MESEKDKCGEKAENREKEEGMGQNQTEKNGREGRIRHKKSSE